MRGGLGGTEEREADSWAPLLLFQAASPKKGVVLVRTGSDLGLGVRSKNDYVHAIGSRARTPIYMLLPRGAFDRILGGQRPNRHLDVKKRFGRENPTRATWP